jgi:phosphatidylethanolamine-binding protein (PEBP) family uncharacterized protein
MSTCNRPFRRLASLALALTVCTAMSFAQDEESADRDRRFHLHSTTFSNDSILPISTINNIVVNGKNGCSINGATGGNKSPELSWSGTPAGTRSFVVTVYDVPAAFTQWGMYNISGDAKGAA